MTTRQRLSASVDAELIEAAEAAVSSGRAPTVSAWVNDALRLKVEHDRRLFALGELIRAHESEHGEITAEQMRAPLRGASPPPVAVRAPEPKTRRRPRRTAATR